VTPSASAVAGILRSLLGMKLQGKVALITGSSGGIGQGVAVRLAREGASVVVNYRSSQAGAEETVASVRPLLAPGARALVVKADTSVVVECERMISESVAQLGRVDVLVNNAGIERRAPFWEVKETDYDAVLDVNLKGAFFMTQAFVRHRMAVKEGGKVINVTSVHQDLPFPNFSPYCASKGGLKMLARDLAIELAPLGITVNNVAPGAIETPINSKLLNDPPTLRNLLKNIPLGRLGTTSDVAGVVAFLASPDADYMTGATLFVDGGLTWNYQEQ
jgi:glucose 1-dehydrogenase